MLNFCGLFGNTAFHMTEKRPFPNQHKIIQYAGNLKPQIKPFFIPKYRSCGKLRNKQPKGTLYVLPTSRRPVQKTLLSPIFIDMVSPNSKFGMLYFQYRKICMINHCNLIVREQDLVNPKFSFPNNGLVSMT